MPFQINSVHGKEGRVTIPAVGVVAGIMRSWTLRREESGPLSGTWTLHASLSYAHEKLLSEPSMNKRIEVTFMRDPETKREKKYRIDCEVLRMEDSSTLTGERGTLWPVE